MRFSSISINLLEFFRIMSFVFELKYLGKNMVNFNILGGFRNPQERQNSKLSLDWHFDEDLRDKIRVLEGVRSYPCQHCILLIGTMLI